MMRGVRASAALLTAASACAALAGCGQAVRPTATAVTPSLDAAAPAQATPFGVRGVTACTAADVDVSIHVADPSYVDAGPHDTSFWVITVRDKASRPCFVGPAPAVSFEAGGQRLDIGRAPPFGNSGGDLVYLAPPKTAAPPFFPMASGEIDVTPCVLHGVDLVSVDLGETLGAVRVAVGPPGGFGTPCPVADEAYSVFLGGQIDGGSGNGAPIPLTQTRISGPATVRRGQVVSFTVTILNEEMPHHGFPLSSPTPQPALSFTPCPSYHVEIEGVPGTFHTYRLDCAGARPLAAGASETFAMRVVVPAGAALGPATLLWSLDGPARLYQAARLDWQIVSG